jgi:hypothetical protein
MRFGRLADDVEVTEDDDVLYVGTCGDPKRPKPGRCGAQWRGQAIAHCAACHLTFSSPTGFDEHRTLGNCRTPDDMRKRGYEPNDEGHWRQPLTDQLPHWEPQQ